MFPSLFLAEGSSELSLATFSNDIHGFKVLGSESSQSGFSVSSAGDINKDGYDDVIIGAPYASTSSRYGAGTSYVIYGGASPTSAPTLAPTAEPTFSVQPSGKPSDQPTAAPTMTPTIVICYDYVNNKSGKITWADFDGDGKVDLLCEPGDGSIKICLSTGGGLECIGELPVHEV